VTWAQGKVGKKVGAGECWDLGNERGQPLPTALRIEFPWPIMMTVVIGHAPGRTPHGHRRPPRCAIKSCGIVRLTGGIVRASADTSQALVLDIPPAVGAPQEDNDAAMAAMLAARA
jgi:hypothetical protein